MKIDQKKLEQVIISDSRFRQSLQKRGILIEYAPNTTVDPQAQRILTALNVVRESLGLSSYKPTTRHLNQISSAIGSHGEALIKTMISAKSKEWGSNPDMRKYIRLETLFKNQSSVDKYLGEIPDKEVTSKSIEALNNLRRLANDYE